MTEKPIKVPFVRANGETYLGYVCEIWLDSFRPKRVLVTPPPKREN